MARRIKEENTKKKELISELITQYGITSVKDLHEALKDIFGSTLQGMLEAELDNH